MPPCTPIPRSSAGSVSDLPPWSGGTNGWARNVISPYFRRSSRHGDVQQRRVAAVAVQEHQPLRRERRQRSPDVVEHGEQRRGRQPDRAGRPGVLVRLRVRERRQQPEIELVAPLLHHCLGDFTGDHVVRRERQVGSVLLDRAERLHEDRVGADELGNLRRAKVGQVSGRVSCAGRHFRHRTMPDGLRRDRRRGRAQRPDLRRLPREGRHPDVARRGPVRRGRVRLDGRRARRSCEHLQLRPRRVPHDAGHRRARPRPPRPALPRRRARPGAAVVGRRGRVARLPRRRAHARRARAASIPTRSTATAATARPRSPSPSSCSRWRASRRRPAASSSASPPDERAAPRRCSAGAASPRPTCCGRSSPRGRDGPRRGHRSRGVGALPVHAPHGPRRAHLRDEARRTRGPARRWQRRGAGKHRSPRSTAAGGTVRTGARVTAHRLRGRPRARASSSPTAP